MSTRAANPNNEQLLVQLRARASNLTDSQLRAKAERVIELVERSETEAPATLLDLPFRQPTEAESRHGMELEALARQLIAGHARTAVA